MRKVQPVILSGGSGTRLWPVSREDLPKQFVPFDNSGRNKSLFKYSLDRLKSAKLELNPPFIIGSKKHRFYIKDQLNESGIENALVFLEPTQKNTAPSLTIAAQLLISDDPILVVLPSDQFIDDNIFNEVIEKAVAICSDSDIILLGVEPRYAETGYGYIEINTPYGGELTTHEIVSFTEKPNLETAKKYVSQKRYLWNSGILIVKASTWLKAINEFRFDIYINVKNIINSRLMRFSDFELTVPLDAFDKVPSDSIDFAVLEKASHSNNFNVRVIEFSGFWTDLGSWKSIYDIVKKDPCDNFKYGQSFLRKTEGSLVISSARPVVVNDLKDVAVIETQDSVLVTKLNSSQEIKSIVEELKNCEFKQVNELRSGIRPWGKFEVIDSAEKFKVKRLVVNPGQSLSLQRHFYRSEHWVVVSGVATVQLDKVIQTVSTNESVYIPCMALHRLSNYTDDILQIIEVQTGSYLGEDDIERIEDMYERI